MVGNVITTYSNHKTIFNLITKEHYFHKPKYKHIQSSLHNLKLIGINFNILNIAMPTIACELDQCN